MDFNRSVIYTHLTETFLADAFTVPTLYYTNPCTNRALRAAQFSGTFETRSHMV